MMDWTFVRLPCLLICALFALAGCPLIAMPSSPRAERAQNEAPAAAREAAAEEPTRGRERGSERQAPAERAKAQREEGEGAQAGGAQEAGEEEEDLPKINSRRLADEGVELSPVSEREVRIFRVGGDDLDLSLPEGADWKEEGLLRKRLVLRSDFPSPEDPHVLLAQYTVDWTRGYNNDDFLAAFKKQAAGDGVNAVFVNLESPTPVALGAYLSKAEAKERKHEPAGKLLRRQAKKIRSEGYRKVHVKFQKDLADFEPPRFRGRRGHCYWLTFALAKDAEKSHYARERVDFEFSSPDKTIDTRSGRPDMKDPRSKARAGSTSIGCPQKGGPIQVEMLAGISRGRSEWKGMHDLGEGTIAFRIYRRSISERELARQRRERKKARQEAKQHKEKRLREICGKCRGKLGACGGQDPERCDPYRICLERRGVDVRECVGR